jgi:arsenate reductase-like glutaredoxin family protein
MENLMKLYGTEKCHKTNYYKGFLKANEVDYVFLEVEKNTKNATELRTLYENRRLNFPTITIGDKKLRNPSDKELQKWLDTK